MKKWLAVIAEKLARALKIASPLITDPKQKVAAAVIAEVLEDDQDKEADKLP